MCLLLKKAKKKTHKKLAWSDKVPCQICNVVDNLNSLEKKLSIILENSHLGYHHSRFHSLFAVSGPSRVKECSLCRWGLQISRESLFLQLEIQSCFLQGHLKGSQGYLCALLWTGSLLMGGRGLAQFPGRGLGQSRRFCLLPLCCFLGLFRLLFFCL